VIDAWSGPPPTPQQFPPNEPNGIRKLLDKIKALELQIREATSNLLGTAGIRLTQLGMFIDSSLTVGGSLDVTGPMVVGGTLSLPAGIINNDALTSPVVADIVNLTNTGFTVPANPTWGNAVSTTITVPPGCTQLLATCTAEAYAINPNTTGGSNGTGGDILDCRVLLNGSASAGYGIGLSGSNGFTSSSSSGSFHFSGLTPGATLSIATQVLAVYQAFGSNVDNKATINATLIWLR
jgi:hypothetical protein